MRAFTEKGRRQLNSGRRPRVPRALRGRLSLLLLVACQRQDGWSSQSVGGPESPSRAFILNVGGTVSGKDGTRPLLRTPTARSGESIRLTVRASAPTVVYAAFCDTEQTNAVYPRTGELVVGPERDELIPAGGYFELDGRIGLETIYVVAVAAGRSLRDLDPKLASAIERGRHQSSGGPCETAFASFQASSVGSPQPEKPDGTHAREGSSLREAAPESRGRAQVPEIWRPRGVAVEEESNVMASVRSDPMGVAILAVTFSHVP